MKDKIYQLCHYRSVMIPQSEAVEFTTQCHHEHIFVSPGGYSQGRIKYILPRPLSYHEAVFISSYRNRLGTFRYLTETKKYKPFEALVEMNLL